MQTIDTAADRRLYDGTTQGEWRLAEKGNTVPSIAITTTAYDGAPPVNICCGISPKRIDDAQFMARAHNSFPAWMDEIDKGREAQRKLEEAQAVARSVFDAYYNPLGGPTIHDLMRSIRRIAGEGGQDE